jgi:hypothetical protein
MAMTSESRNNDGHAPDTTRGCAGMPWSPTGPTMPMPTPPLIPIIVETVKEIVRGARNDHVIT